MLCVVTIKTNNNEDFVKEVDAETKSEAIRIAIVYFLKLYPDETFLENDNFSITCNNVNPPHITKEDLSSIQKLIHGRDGDAKNEEELCVELERTIIQIAQTLHLETRKTK